MPITDTSRNVTYSHGVLSANRLVDVNPLKVTPEMVCPFDPAACAKTADPPVWRTLMVPVYPNSIDSMAGAAPNEKPVGSVNGVVWASNVVPAGTSTKTPVSSMMACRNLALGVAPANESKFRRSCPQ